MSAEILRSAASLMRERAEAATGTVWSVDPSYGGQVEADGARPDGGVLLFSGCCTGDGYTENFADATHIAGMSPAVALAVADWLDLASDAHERFGPDSNTRHALTVARAYLGEDQ